MPTTPTIRDLFPADRLDRSIEEVIKLDQQEEATVRQEIEEYVATERIQQDYERFLREYSDGLSNPDERTGVWISGFFGSGKSSFAKNLGYVLQNRTLGDAAASDIFMQRLKEAGDTDRVRNLEQIIQFINARIPTHVIMFDVRLIASQGSEPVHQLMYAKLLEDLDYASDPKVAELEIDLEADNHLGEFIQICARFFGDEVRTIAEPHPVPVTLQDEVSEADYNIWVRVRMMSDRSQRILTVLREQFPNLYSDASSLNLSETQLNIDVLVDRTFELASRRVPSHAITYARSSSILGRKAQTECGLGKPSRPYGSSSHPRKSWTRWCRPLTISGWSWHACRIASPSRSICRRQTSAKSPACAYWQKHMMVRTTSVSSTTATFRS